jgi:tryptophan synthase beta chain
MKSYFNAPDERGLFGIFGGRYVAETLMPLILQLGEGLRRSQKR